MRRREAETSTQSSEFFDDESLKNQSKLSPRPRVSTSLCPKTTALGLGLESVSLLAS